MSEIGKIIGVSDKPILPDIQGTVQTRHYQGLGYVELDYAITLKHNSSHIEGLKRLVYLLDEESKKIREYIKDQGK